MKHEHTTTCRCENPENNLRQYVITTVFETALTIDPTSDDVQAMVKNAVQEHWRFTVSHLKKFEAAKCVGEMATNNNAPS